MRSIDAVYCYTDAVTVVCLCLCVVAETDEPIEVSSGWDSRGPQNHVLDGFEHWRHLANAMELSVRRRAAMRVVVNIIVAACCYYLCGITWSGLSHEMHAVEPQNVNYRNSTALQQLAPDAWVASFAPETATARPKLMGRSWTRGAQGTVHWLGPDPHPIPPREGAFWGVVHVLCLVCQTCPRVDILNLIR